MIEIKVKSINQSINGLFHYNLISTRGGTIMAKSNRETLLTLTEEDFKQIGYIRIENGYPGFNKLFGLGEWFHDKNVYQKFSQLIRFIVNLEWPYTIQCNNDYGMGGLVIRVSANDVDVVHDRFNALCNLLLNFIKEHQPIKEAV